MPAADESPDGFVADAVDQLRHDLKSPLTTISARGQLLERSIRRAPSLTDEERVKLVEGLMAITGAVRAMVTMIDTIGLPSRDGPSDPTGMRR